MGIQGRIVLFTAGRPVKLRFFLFAFAAFYLLNCFAPLRLEYDSIRYFSLKECLEGACPPGFVAANDPHPLGYPVFLWMLAKMGLLRAFVIAFVNALFLAGSLFFVWGSFVGAGFVESDFVGASSVGSPFPAFRGYGFFPLVLLQWTFIKFFSYPLSEMQYLFFSSACIYCFRRGWWVSAFLAAGLAFFTRSAGALLVVGMLADLGWRFRSRWMWIVAAVVVCVVCGFLFAGSLRLGLYLHSFLDRGSMLSLAYEHLKEWGSLLLNVPGNKVPGWGSWGLMLLGGLSLGLFGYALFVHRKDVPVVIAVYLVLYILLIFNWPYFDARFWVPVFPFVVMIVLLRFRFRFHRLWAAAIGVYLVMGLGAGCYSVYTTFNKKALAKTQAGGSYRNEYETYFFGRPVSDTATRIDPYVLSVLKRYN